MNKLRTLALAAALSLCGVAWAGPPLVSETADALENGKCEVEAGHSRESASGLPALRATDVVFSCGVAATTQAAVGYTRARLEGITAQGLRVFGKTNLVAIEGRKAGWGVAYGVEAVKLPGTSWRSEFFDVTGLYSRELAPGVLMHANLGHSQSRTDKQGTTLWSLGIETTGTFFAAADLFGDDRSKPWVSGGVGYAFGGGFSANASLAMQFDKPRVRVLTLGAKLEF